MDASIILQKIRRKGFLITPSGSQISIKPKKLLNGRMIAFLQAHKNMLLTALYQEQDNAKILHQKKMRALHPGRLHVLKMHIQHRLRAEKHYTPTDKEINDSLGTILVESDYDLENAISTHQFAIDLYTQTSLETAITCDACKHFSPDRIGDGAGIGSCELKVPWTQGNNGRVPLYRYARRHCDGFIMSTANLLEGRP